MNALHGRPQLTDWDQDQAARIAKEAVEDLDGKVRRLNEYEAVQ